MLWVHKKREQKKKSLVLDLEGKNTTQLFTVTCGRNKPMHEIEIVIRPEPLLR